VSCWNEVLHICNVSNFIHVSLELKFQGKGKAISIRPGEALRVPGC
jgi:hypothetical protein